MVLPTGLLFLIFATQMVTIFPSATVALMRNRFEPTAMCEGVTMCTQDPDFKATPILFPQSNSPPPLG